MRVEPLILLALFTPVMIDKISESDIEKNSNDKNSNCREKFVWDGKKFKKKDYRDE